MGLAFNEEKLIREAKAQLLPEVERLLAVKMAELRQHLSELLTTHTITITITPK